MDQLFVPSFCNQLSIQLLFSSQHPYLMCIGQWKQTTYISALRSRNLQRCVNPSGPFMEVHSQNIVIRNPKVMELDGSDDVPNIMLGWFSGWSGHQFVWGSEIIFPHKHQPKRTYPPKDLANSRPTMVWYGTPINGRKYMGFHWDRSNWRYNHYKWPYKWGSLGL